jgi:RNA polymerase sigma-70 factor (ECF subfamily)
MELAKDRRVVLDGPVGFPWPLAGREIRGTRPEMKPEHQLPEPAEADLLRQVAAGDANAFSKLYDLFSGVLFSFAARILQDESAAEDVLQEAFVQIWERAAAYDPRLGKPITWAVTLTRNKAIDRLRAAQRGHRIVEAATHEQAGREMFAATSGEEVVSQERARMVREALARLPADQRQAIEMAFFGGLSQSEIASALQAPLGTIKARIRRGMLQLRGTLEMHL